MTSIGLTKTATGIAVLTLDNPRSSVNTLSSTTLGDLQAALDEVFRDKKIIGCVITSAKKSTFLAGADLNEIAGVSNSKEAEKFVRFAQDIFQRIADSPIPFVAAIHGAALGGGLELALACHHRVASLSSETVLGLPEVQLGLIPAAGGTQRLYRLIGLKHALPLILAGTRVRPDKALKLGLVDRVVDPAVVLDTAISLASSKQNITKKRRPTLESWMELPVINKIALAKVKKETLKKTRGHYPAPLAILTCIETGLRHGLRRGLEAEASCFATLAVGQVSKNLIWLFLATNQQKKTESPNIAKLGVIGAGLMGEGIAAVSLPLSSVVLKDVSDQSLEKARSGISSFLEKRNKGALTSKLSTTTSYEPLKDCDFIVEAVFEEIDLKKTILADIESVVSSATVFASNTSALPIHAIAKNAKHPERVIGMHYISPVQKMPLLEIVVAERTSQEVVEKARRYGAAQGKTVIVVKDKPGFYTTRILAPLLNEAMLLLEEGVRIEAVDAAMKSFGFPVGPVLLLDEVGIDVGGHVAHDLGLAFGSRWGRTSEALGKLVKDGYLGKKNQKGFYTKDKRPNDAVYRYFGNPPVKTISSPDIYDRVALVMVNEALFCLQEGVIAEPKDGDLGAILGLGFPPFRGGPFHYLDQIGLHVAVEKMRRLSTLHGKRFEPAPVLVEMAKRGERFYKGLR